MEFSNAKTQEAASALQKYLKKIQNSSSASKKSLFEDEGSQENLYINITTKKYVTDHKSLKPKRIPVPHRLTAADDSIEVCLICKDPQRTYKDALLKDDEEIPALKRVIGVSKFKGKFKSFEARRLLKSQYDIFVAEDSVVTTLPKLLGKIFYDSKKIPLAIKTKNGKGEISSSKVKNEIDAILNSTILTVPSGLTFSVKVGTVDFTPEQIAENVDAVVKYFTDKIVNLDGIRTIQLKTASSPSLPIYIVDKIYDDKSDVVVEETKVTTKRKRSDSTTATTSEDAQQAEEKKSILAKAWEDILDDDTLNEYKNKYKKTNDAVKAAAASIASEIRD